MDEGAEWSYLPKELWPMIGKCLQTRIDLLRFRSVCKSWRSSVPPCHPKSPSFPLRVPHPTGPAIDAQIVQTTIYLFQQPGASGNPNETRTPSPSSSLSTSKGWLIKVEESDSAPMRLLPSLSNRAVWYPPGTFPKTLNLLDYRVIELYKTYNLRYLDGFSSSAIHKVVLSPNYCWTNSEESVIFCIYQEGRLGFMKYGEDDWTLVDDKNFYYDDIIVHKGQFYVVDRWGTIYWIDVSSLKLVQFSPPLCGFGNMKRLVESCGSLYVVDKFHDRDPRRRMQNHDMHVDDYYSLLGYGPNDAEVVNFKVYKLDEEWGTWVDVKNLGDRAFVLGNDCSFSVSAKEFAGCRENCIYFCDMFGARVYGFDEQGIFTLENLLIGSDWLLPPPTWIR